MFYVPNYFSSYCQHAYRNLLSLNIDFCNAQMLQDNFVNSEKEFFLSISSVQPLVILNFKNTGKYEIMPITLWLSRYLV